MDPKLGIPCHFKALISPLSVMSNSTFLLLAIDALYLIGLSFRANTLIVHCQSIGRRPKAIGLGGIFKGKFQGGKNLKKILKTQCAVTFEPLFEIHDGRQHPQA
jgi:hypothetical protein